MALRSGAGAGDGFEIGHDVSAAHPACRRRLSRVALDGAGKARPSAAPCLSPQCQGRRGCACESRERRAVGTAEEDMNRAAHVLLSLAALIMPREQRVWTDAMRA